MRECTPSAPISASPCDPGAVLAQHGDAVRVLLEAGDARIQSDGIRRSSLDGIQQDAMQVGPVDHEIGRAIALARDRAEIEQLPGFAGAPEPDFLAGRLAPDLFQGGFEPEREQRMRAIRRDLNAGADFCEFAGLLDHADPQAAPDQRQRRGQAADAGTCDQDRGGSGHG